MNAKAIREFFWPLLERPNNKEKNEKKHLNLEDISVEGENLDTAYDLAHEYYKADFERDQNVEKKSAIFVGINGIIITIILALSKELILDTTNKFGVIDFFHSVYLFVIVLYFGRTLWFSIKTLKRSSFYLLSDKDFIKNDENFKKNLIKKYINCTKKNCEGVNRKVDGMVMAQEYFKRGIVAAILYPAMLIIFALLREIIG